MLRIFLKRLLLNSSNGLAVAGVPLDLGNGRSLLVFAKLHCILSDGDGLRMGFNWFGGSGLKPCIKHFNVFKEARCDVRR